MPIEIQSLRTYGGTANQRAFPVVIRSRKLNAFKSISLFRAVKAPTVYQLLYLAGGCELTALATAYPTLV